MKVRAEVYQRSDGMYEWRLVAANEQIVATSGGQGYQERNDCREGLERVVDALLNRALEIRNVPGGK